MFKGHKFVKLTSNNWVFDLTEFIGYRVYTTANSLEYQKAFRANMQSNNMVRFEKYTGVPIKVLKESDQLINGYVGIRG